MAIDTSQIGSEPYKLLKLLLIYAIGIKLKIQQFDVYQDYLKHRLEGLMNRGSDESQFRF